MAMQTFRTLKATFFAVSDFVWPRYQPERHYMRGPGPACARRGKSVAGGQG